MDYLYSRVYLHHSQSDLSFHPVRLGHDLPAAHTFGLECFSEILDRSGIPQVYVIQGDAKKHVLLVNKIMLDKTIRSVSVF